MDIGDKITRKYTYSEVRTCGSRRFRPVRPSLLVLCWSGASCQLLLLLQGLTYPELEFDLPTQGSIQVNGREAAKVKKKCVTHDTVVFLRVTIDRISMADRTAWFENILLFCGVVWYF